MLFWRAAASVLCTVCGLHDARSRGSIPSLPEVRMVASDRITQSTVLTMRGRIHDGGALIVCRVCDDVLRRRLLGGREILQACRYGRACGTLAARALEADASDANRLSCVGAILAVWSKMPAEALAAEGALTRAATYATLRGAVPARTWRLH
jgi:hypothetical protein